MAATLVFTEIAERQFQHFLNYEVPKMLGQLEDTHVSTYFFCCFNSPEELSRRLLVVTDAGSRVVRVCIEAAYELFEGDIHYKVERVGTVERSQLNTELVPLMFAAFDKLVKWRPTQENIWDNVY